MSLAVGDIFDEGKGGNFALASLQTPDAIVTKIGAEVNGKTADEIIQVADVKAKERAQRRLTAIDCEGVKLQQEIATLEQLASEVKQQLGNISILGSRYYWQTGFTVLNGSSPIRSPTNQTSRSRRST